MKIFSLLKFTSLVQICGVKLYLQLQSVVHKMPVLATVAVLALVTWSVQEQDENNRTAQGAKVSKLALTMQGPMLLNLSRP